MKVGVTLPQFRADPAGAIEAARTAEEQGLDGVFVFDHLWAIGQPDRPALACWPLLGALAARTTTIALGTLVARVSLAPDAVLAHQFETLARIADASGTPHRIVAGLGTGDRLSESENVAYGIPFPPLEERLAQLADCARRTRQLGLETWVGGRSQAVKRIAADPDIGVDALNLWDASPQDVRDAANHPGIKAVTWGGTLPGTGTDTGADSHTRTDTGAVTQLLRDLREAGAQWAICGPRYRDRDPKEAVATVAAAAKAISLAP